jgi:hypothetical protein
MRQFATYLTNTDRSWLSEAKVTARHVIGWEADHMGVGWLFRRGR